jgi:chromosomal replication initiator protein
VNSPWDQEKITWEEKVVYITSDQFVSEYVNAVKDRKIDQMRARFRTIDVLLVDDIQFLAGKKGTQEEIYTLFNILYDAGKQIILSSDRPPKELTEIEPRDSWADLSGVSWWI